LAVEPEALRALVREKYRHVALQPLGAFHFHTGRALAVRLGYDPTLVAGLPDRAVESFAGVANPFSCRPLCQGDRVVDVGSGGGFDAIVAAHLVGGDGRVVGVDMTPEMLAKARETARLMGLGHVEFRQGLAEDLPIEDGWAGVVISNGVLNLVADKAHVFREIFRVLRPGGGSSSPTSPSAGRSRRSRSATSTYGPIASPAACPVIAGRRHFGTPGSSTSRSDRL